MKTKDCRKIGMTALKPEETKTGTTGALTKEEDIDYILRYF